MKTLRATNSELFLDNGFLSVSTECGKNLQICLDRRKDGNGFKKEIEGDGGFWSGLCNDANGDAIDEYGSDEVLLFLLKTAKKEGVIIL